MEFLLDGEVLAGDVDAVDGFLSETVCRVGAALRALSETLDLAV